MSKNTKPAGGKNTFHFLRMSNYYPAPELDGIARVGVLSGSILSTPFLEPPRPDNGAFKKNGEVGIKEEAVRAVLPENLAKVLRHKFRGENLLAKDGRKRGRETVSSNILIPVEYSHFGVRLGLEGIPNAFCSVRSKIFRDTLREIFDDCLDIMRKEGESFMRVEGRENYRAVLRDCLTDFSFSSNGDYPRLSLNIFAKASHQLEQVVSALGIKRDMDDLLLGDDPYKPAIIIELNRAGFGYDIDFSKIDPKRFRKTDKLPRNIIF